MRKPKGIEEYLYNSLKEIIDSTSGEPVAWGFALIKGIPSSKFEAIRNNHFLYYVEDIWYLIVKTLSRDEAIVKYGAITEEEVGPRGGWRSVTFGKVKFKSKFMKP